MIRFIRYLFFLFLVRPLVLFILGINVHYRQRMPSNGPAIIVANHNSHLDTLILMNLFPLKKLPSIRPVAAADYFLKNRMLAWFSSNIIGIIAISRRYSRHANPLNEISEILLNNGIVIFYPEGTRGNPEQLGQFKSGIAHIAKKHPQVPVIPVFLYGAGKALPKGEALLVPLAVDIKINIPIQWNGDKQTFISELESVFINLSSNHDLERDI